MVKNLIEISVYSVCLTLAVASSPAQAEPAKTDMSLASCGKPETMKADNSDIHVEAQVFIRKGCIPDGIGSFWGATDIPVSKFIGALNVRVDPNNEVNVPLSSFIDLGDPAQIKIANVAGKKFSIIIDGSGDSKYIAQLDVDGDGVVARKVYNQDFPDESGEKTQYLYVTGN
jgi:hypothetical protein